ncbi:hypothetical protein D3C76_02510 [compost metagenome]
MEDKIELVIKELLLNPETAELGKTLDLVNTIRLSKTFSMLDIHEHNFFKIRKDALSKNINIEFLDEVFDFLEAVYLAEKIAEEENKNEKYFY